MNPTEQAHQNLRSVLLTGRILVNGMPLTTNELVGLVQGEQMLFEKAFQLDKTQELAANVKEEKKPPQKPNIIKMKKE